MQNVFQKMYYLKMAKNNLTNKTEKSETNRNGQK